MTLKKCDAAAIVALVIFMAGSPIFANQAFAISSIAKIIDSVVVGPCTQESGKFMYLICSKLDPSLLTNGLAVKNLLLSDKVATEQCDCIEIILVQLFEIIQERYQILGFH